MHKLESPHLSATVELRVPDRIRDRVWFAIQKPAEWQHIGILDLEGRTIWIADAHRGDGKRYVVRSDEILTAFLELESAVAAT